MEAPFLIGRAILGGFFIHNGVNHFLQHKRLSQHAESKNVRLPGVGVAVSGVALIAGGTSILLGVKPKSGCCWAACCHYSPSRSLGRQAYR